ncbi:MAG: cbb3-type cytochrome c oxidase subunit 3 [Corticimicrobacter sp.]|uniref:cbb3-type cytochrome oxidase subunit 3 n=1 Tax=Corticimicrobacter sp. TaxID=2678536 RepID=UPI0032DB7D5A
MNGTLNGIMTLVGLVFFIGIVWWAFSKGRKKANEEAAMLPFDLPEEDSVEQKERKNGHE